jgi:hypothetical protein
VTAVLNVFVILPIYASCPTDFILLVWIIIIKYGEKPKVIASYKCCKLYQNKCAIVYIFPLYFCNK